MTTTKKTVQRKHTRKTEEKRADALDQGYRVKVDGKVYKVTAGDLTGLDSRALRTQAGITFPGLLSQLVDDFDIDTLAVMIWLARRVHGERALSFEQVAAEVGYEDLEALKIGPEDEDPDDAEDDAPGE